MTILTLLLIQEEKLPVNGKRIYLKYRYTVHKGLPGNSLVMITDRPNITTAIYCKREFQNQSNIILLYGLNIYGEKVFIIFCSI